MAAAQVSLVSGKKPLLFAETSGKIEKRNGNRRKFFERAKRKEGRSEL
jgi:hypothetical protein